MLGHKIASVQHEKGCSHTSISFCFFYSTAIILLKIPGQLLPTHLSPPQAFLSIFIRFCHVFHLKSASQKGPVVKLWYQSLTRYQISYTTELCWRQMKKISGIGHRMRLFIFYLYITTFACWELVKSMLPASWKSPLIITVLQECLLFSGLVYQRAHKEAWITQHLHFIVSCPASSEMNLPGGNTF